MNFNRNLLSEAVRYGLAAGAVGLLGLTAAPAFAQDEDEATRLERIEVTGSRIKRADVEGALPVTVIDRQQLELSGQTSVADFLQQTTFNSFGSFRPQSGSSAQSFAELSLRGLGGGRTLILIDGRRAPTAPQTGEGQDLNSIPLAAVERIEILSDGASAIYGADAIAGVVNIITRKDFNGVEMSLGASNPKRPGGETEEGSVIFGTSSDRGRMLAGASYNSRGIVFARERPWSTGGASTFSNNYRLVIQNPNTGARLVGSFFNNPNGGGSIVPGGCGGPAFFTSATRCFYDFSTISADEAEIRNQAMFVRADYEITEDWSTYMNASVSRVKSFGRYAPTPENIFVPAGSPNNVTGQDIFISHRFAALGPRDTYSDSPNYDLLVGFQGRIGSVDLDFGFRKNDSRYNEAGYNYVNKPAAEAFFADGTYNVFDPFANSQDVLDRMKITTGREGKFVQEELFALANFDLFELSGGTSGMAIGFESRKEDFADIYDQASAAGNVGGSAGNSSFGDRKQNSVFFEVLMPFLSNFEVSLAGRYDDYDDFGSDFTPKVALRWQPLDSLTFRASWGEGFRAPPLSILNQLPAFSAAFVVDPPTAAAFGLGAGTQLQINGLSVATPDLSAETSEQYSLGLAWAATDWLDLTLDYWNIDIENRVAFLGAQTIINRTNQGLPFPSQFGVVRNPDGSIAEVRFGSGNEGRIKSDGYDLNVRTNFDLGNFGSLRNELNLGYVNSYEIFGLSGGTDIVGDAGSPKWRANLQNVWAYGDFTVAWNIRVIDDQPTIGAQTPCTIYTSAANCAALAPNTGSAAELFGYALRRPTYVIHDLQGSWAAPWNARITLGVTNLLDKDPILDEFESRSYDNNLSDGWGRVPYIRYTQSF